MLGKTVKRMVVDVDCFLLFVASATAGASEAGSIDRAKEIFVCGDDVDLVAIPSEP